MIRVTPLRPRSHPPTPAVTIVRESNESLLDEECEINRPLDESNDEPAQLSLQTPSDDDDLSYEAVPFKSVGKITVQYRKAEPLQPRIFNVDDEGE